MNIVTILLKKHYQQEPRRPEISAKNACEPCQRRAWLESRHLYTRLSEVSEIRQQRRRQIEARQLLDELQLIGLEVHDIHPKSNEPIRFFESGIHIHMHALGRVKPPAQDADLPRGWTLIQVESVEHTLFLACVRARIKGAYPELYAKCQLGMGASKLHQCLVYLSSDSGDVYMEILRFDEDDYAAYCQQATVIAQDKVPDRIDPMACVECKHRVACFQKTHIPPVNCRSCYFHSMDTTSSTFYCRKHLTHIEQRIWDKGCSAHVFKPELINFATCVEVESLDDGHVTIHYLMAGGTGFSNTSQTSAVSGMIFDSKQIESGGLKLISAPFLKTVKEKSND